jgi:hypothetical protein
MLRPTALAKRTRAPALAAAAAWFAPLLPGKGAIALAEHGFARVWQAFERDDEVDIDRSKDDDHGGVPKETRAPGGLPPAPSKVGAMGPIRGAGA